MSTIKAAVFEGVKPSAPFVRLTQIQAPVAGTGDVVVRVLATRVLSYTGDIFNGTRRYPSRLPMVPGSAAVGVIKSVGPANVNLQVGQMVFIDHTIRTRDHPISPQLMLQGLIAVGEAQKLQDIWLNGSWAEEMLVPVENVTVIPPSVQAKFDATQLTSLGNYDIAYGGFSAAGFKAGQTVAITGSTGPFGASAVAVALSLGARRVWLKGRRASTGDVAEDTRSIKEAAGEGFAIDSVFDILPPGTPFAIARSAISALRFGGTAVLMGGIQASVEFPYNELMRNNITIKGNFMYTRDAPTLLIALADAGLLDLGTVKGKIFKLDEIDSAIEYAAAHAGPFEITVVLP